MRDVRMFQHNQLEKFRVWPQFRSNPLHNSVACSGYTSYDNMP